MGVGRALLLLAVPEKIADPYPGSYFFDHWIWDTDQEWKKQNPWLTSQIIFPRDKWQFLGIKIFKILCRGSGSGDKHSGSATLLPDLIHLSIYTVTLHVNKNRIRYPIQLLLFYSNCMYIECTCPGPPWGGRAPHCCRPSRPHPSQRFPHGAQFCNKTSTVKSSAADP